jgi:hypothetical protein
MSSFVAYAWNAGNTKEVFRISESGHILEMGVTVGYSWGCADLTTISGAPLAPWDAALCGYLYSPIPAKHVAYVTGDGHIHELGFMSGQNWIHDDVADAQFPSAGTDICGYEDEFKKRHIIYSGADGHLRDIPIKGEVSPAGDIKEWWQSVDLTALSKISA